MFDIITTRHYLDKFIDVQERQVVLQFGAFAIGREGDPAAAARKRLEHLADTAKSVDAVKVFGFIESLMARKICLRWDAARSLKRLVAIEARV